MSTFRVRARSAGLSRSTSRPFSQYRPDVGVTSKARIDRNVDLPQPDGPDTDTYSPRSISTVTFRSATAGSSASPSKVLVTPSRRMSGIRVDADASVAVLDSRFHQDILGLDRFDGRRPENVGGQRRFLRFFGSFARFATSIASRAHLAASSASSRTDGGTW